MSTCDQLAANASAGVAPALRAVDCLSNEMASVAFGRLFAPGGVLGPVLISLLTIYVAFFAYSLLTGRSRIGISALTPRMLTLGLVLTFATSWAAYQSVVWNLAMGAPDQIAGIITGLPGSATRTFGDRIDMVFAAIAEVAAPGVTNGESSEKAMGTFTPGNLIWLSALILLLGTVGVLITARIALAVLLAVGPLFIVFGLFDNTRGLTAGWLRGVVLTAITPLFTVVGGGLVMELLVPIIASLRGGDGGVSGQGAMALFLIASVHMALMVMMLRVSATMVAAWNVFGLGRSDPAPERSHNPAPAPLVSYSSDRLQAAQAPASAPRALPVIASAPALAATGGPDGPGSSRPAPASTTTTITRLAPTTGTNLPPLAPLRSRGLGSRYRAAPRQPREMLR